MVVKNGDLPWDRIRKTSPSHINLGKPEGFSSVSCQVWWKDFDSDTRSSLAEIDLFFFSAVELFRFTSLFRGDRQVQGHASRVGGRLFKVCHDRLEHPHLLPHSLIVYPGKKKDAHHAHRNLNFHPLGQLLLVTWVATWVFEQSRPLSVPKFF